MQGRLPAVFMRGGTSKALMFHSADLPPDREKWTPIFLAVMGSPDPNGRQLDGMGGGISSLSKVCVIGPPSRADADVDYTFVQVSVEEASADYAGNCGNMSSAVGPFAVDEGIVKVAADGPAQVRIHNVNTGKIIVAHFPVRGGVAAVDGDCEIDGVAGTGAPIRLDFLHPGGAKTGRILPTGNPRDLLYPEVGRPIEASMVDAANPCVFVRAADLGLAGTETPQQMEASSALLERLESIRRAASIAMGLAPDGAAAERLQSIPKVAMVAPPAPMRSLSGREIGADEVDLLVRMISVGRPHRAVPLTGGLCLSVACRIPGSIAASVVRAGRSGPIRIGHPSGVLLVDAVAKGDGQTLSVPHATVYRTARRLFKGEVFYRLSQV